MSRIRSIHPKILTDEAFMTLTVECPLAIALLIGLWMEADDSGTFEWKMLTIKARILPVVNADIAGLLKSLCDGGFIKRFEVDGKPLGVIRNFVKYQRPKSPQDVFPFTSETRAYAGFENGKRPRSDTGRPPAECEPDPDPEKPLPNSFRTPSEKGAQREEGGGRKNEVKSSLPPITAASDADASRGGGDYFDKFYKMFPKDDATSPVTARKAFSELSPDEQSKIAEAMPRIAEHLRRQKPTRPHNPTTFIRERKFEGLIAGPVAGSDAKFFVREGTRQWEAWKTARGRAPPVQNGGWYFPSEWPPPRETAEVIRLPQTG